ncbi:hypothetical protein EPR50_G00022770 [Perca flavescens]|uniref:Uncharacterized protein n=1 Tax=Perca flavescens TaxID=8167 RepID=A0A484DJ21_PERFV|nr:hypothetical protein EPR50_G00022770 [Perca flavescens]
MKPIWLIRTWETLSGRIVIPSDHVSKKHSAAPTCPVDRPASGAPVLSTSVIASSAGRGRQHGGDSSTDAETRIIESGTLTCTQLCIHSAGQSAQ